MNLARPTYQFSPKGRITIPEAQADFECGFVGDLTGVGSGGSGSRAGIFLDSEWVFDESALADLCT